MSISKILKHFDKTSNSNNHLLRNLNELIYKSTTQLLPLKPFKNLYFNPNSNFLTLIPHILLNFTLFTSCRPIHALISITQIETWPIIKNPCPEIDQIGLISNTQMKICYNSKNPCLEIDQIGLISNTQMKICYNSKNPCLEIDQIAKRAEKNCEMLKPSKNYNLNPNLISLKPCIFPINVNRSLNFTNFTSFRLIRGLMTRPSCENPCFETDKIAKETENICKMLSSQKSSLTSIELVLDNCDIEISEILVLEVLKKLSNAGLLALSFFKWAENKNGFEHTTDTYNVVIEALGKIKQFNLIWDLVNKEMKRKGLLSKETFALISRRYARGRKIKEAIDSFERTEKFGFKLELQDYNRLIDTLSKSRNVERAHQVFDNWKNKKFRPDIKSYTILLEGWGQEQNLLRLDEVYREMREDGFQPDVVTYGIIINAYCKARKYDDAIRLYNEMKGKGVKPSPHIYCSLINGLGAEKRLDEAVNYFGELKMSGFEPEMPTYNALVGAYCWSNRIYDAYRVVDEMRKSEIGPNSRTFDIILHHLVKGKRNKEAYSVFQKMGDEKGCEPTVSTYEIMVRMFCHEERTDMAVRVWDQMRERGVLPGMHMFSALINGLCHEHKVDEACKYFEEMLHMGIRPPTHMFKHLKRVLLDEGKEDTLLSLGRRIENLRGTLDPKKSRRKAVGPLRRAER